MMWISALLFLISVVQTVTTSHQVHLDTPFTHELKTQALYDYLDYLMKAFRVPGISLAVVYADKDATLISRGKSTENGEASSEETLYCIASNSKAFLATSVGLLIDDFANGKNATALPAGVELTWHTKVKDLLLDEWKLQDEWASEKASLLDLLGHVSGLPSHDSSMSYDDSIENMVHRLQYLRPSYELRSQYQYTNLMYMTLSYVVSRLSGLPYPAFVQQRLFTPLNMSSSTYYPQVADNSGKLSHVWMNNAGAAQNETRRVPYFLWNWAESAVRVQAGAGGIITSAKDLAQWVRTILNNGEHHGTGEQVIPNSVLETITAGQVVAAGKGPYPELSVETYGAGWMQASYQGHQIISHGGSVPGYSSSIFFLPNNGFGIAALSNGDKVHGALESAMFYIIEDILELKYVNWPERFLSKARSKAQTAEHAVAPTVQHLTLLPLSSFVGTYANPGYFGNFTLCAYPADPNTSCSSLLSEYATVDPHFSISHPTTLYALWNRRFSSHLRLLRRTDTIFGVTLERVYPEGYGEDTSPFLVRRSDAPEGSYGEFLVEDGQVKGLGVWDMEAGPRKRVPGKIKESAEVYFAIYAPRRHRLLSVNR